MNSELNLRLARFAKELWAIQYALIEAAGISTPNASESDKNFVYPGVDNDSLQDVKGGVDHMRHLLWVHLEEAKKRTGGNLDDIILEYRIRRILEMTGSVHSDLRRQKRSLTPELRKMADELRSLIDELISPAELIVEK